MSRQHKLRARANSCKKWNRLIAIWFRFYSINFYRKQFYYITQKGIVCGLAMSGIEVSNEHNKKSQAHACASCMNTVVKTFNHFQERIIQLKREKANLQKELNNLNEEGKEQKRAMTKKIRILHEKLDKLKKKSETHI